MGKMPDKENCLLQVFILVISFRHDAPSPKPLLPLARTLAGEVCQVLSWWTTKIVLSAVSHTLHHRWYHGDLHAKRHQISLVSKRRSGYCSKTNVMLKYANFSKYAIIAEWKLDHLIALCILSIDGIRQVFCPLLYRLAKCCPPSLTSHPTIWHNVDMMVCQQWWIQNQAQ